jgi:hypothetical protein
MARARSEETVRTLLKNPRPADMSRNVYLVGSVPMADAPEVF